MGFLNTSTNNTSEPVRSRRLLLRRVEANGTAPHNFAIKVNSVRVNRERRPLGLTAAAVRSLLRAAGESSHGLARHNYALVQLMLQSGLRIGELAALQRSNIVLRDRGGTVRMRNGKGLKEREVR